MTFEELQREHAEDLQRGRLPVPQEKYATRRVRYEELETTVERGYAKILSTPEHSTATVRWLQYPAHDGTVAVHFRYCDFTGHGNEMFSGHDTLTLAEFLAKFPVKLEE